MYNKSSELSRRDRDVSTLYSKLEQDDKLLAELDNRLRSSTATTGSTSRRVFLDDDGAEEKAEGQYSMPSVNSTNKHEWKHSHYDSGYKNTNNINESYRVKETTRNTREISSSELEERSSRRDSDAMFDSQLRQLEERIAAARSDHLKLISSKAEPDRIANKHNSRSKERDLDSLKPMISKASTKIDSSYGKSQEKSVTLVDRNGRVSRHSTTHQPFTIGPRSTSNLTSKDLDKLMEKLENDNKILAELDRKLYKSTTTSGLIDSSIGALSSSLPSLNTSVLPQTSAIVDRVTSSMGIPGTGAISSALSGTGRIMLPTLPSTAGISVSTITRPHTSTASIGGLKPLDDLKQAEEVVDSIEIPGRGRCKVFIARFNYDPYKQSPNDNPEAEVTLLAGDFILVLGNIDDDGFYSGELLDGRRGLVPSNFVEKLTGEDLFEFQASVLYGHNKECESDTASYPPEFYDAILNETLAHSNFQHLLAPDDFHRINDYIDLEDATEIDEDISDPERAEHEAAKTTVPPPQRLILERQLHKSVLIGWLHPECPRTMIDHYQIYVDGVQKATIPSGDRTKALVEGVDSSMPHRISVRAVDRNGRSSKDPGCTIVIGKNIPFAPCCVKASNITSDSALISWIPCNSNFYHVVAVNSVEVRTVRPSVFKHLINGLSANTLYRVSVRAKPGKLLCSDEKNPKKLEMLTTFVDFRTLPKSLPDPPVDIQVESGPQEGTLLVTWLPITLNQFGTSNNCPVTGYAVFAGHKKLAEIDSPTGDHALLEINTLEHLHKKLITVRTKSGENLSQDSMPCQIPDDLLKLPSTNNPNFMVKRAQVMSDSESDTELTRLMHNVARRNKEFDLVPQPYLPQQPQLQQQPFVAQMLPAQQQQQQPMQASQRYSQLQNPIPGYDMRHKMIANRQANLLAATTRTGSRMGNRNPNLPQPLGAMHPNDNMARMTIPAIEITKETPSESVHPVESYSEEEFDHSMKPRVFGAKRSGVSPMPPQRTRVLSEFERSHFGPYNQSLGQRRGQREHGVRWFVALFDYDPLSMSPNPDAAEEELPFQEGQLIKIYGDKDADGFYRGEANGRMGFVPCNMVSEVQYDVDNDPRFRNNPNDPWAHLPIRKMIALYDYDPQELSPNFDAEMELGFRTGDIIYVYGDMDEDGFYMGEVNGVRGLVPSNFLSDAGPVETSNVRHGKLLLGQQQQQLSQARPLNQSTMGGLAHSQGVMSVNQQPAVSGQFTQVAQQARFNQPGQGQVFDLSAQAGALYHGQHPMQPAMQQVPIQPQQPVQPGQQQFSYQAGSQMNVGLTQSQQQQGQMYQNQGSYHQQLSQPQQQQQQQQNPQLQVNQSIGRGMRQQNPMMNMGHQPQGQFNTMFQGPGTGLGNKQRPTSLDLNTGPPRFGQQMGNQSFGGPMQAQQGSQLQLPNQQQQQQQSSGMLGSLFASGKKMLEEATTPLGARGPMAHPNQPHQPMMGHQQVQQAANLQSQSAIHPPGQMAQQMYGQQQAFGQNFNPLTGQPNQPSGTILNTMKSIFKL